MPSIPQSLLWISLVVLWLFVLVPMLISKRDAVRRTSDVALATRRPEGISTRNILPGTLLEIRTAPGSAFAETLIETGEARLRARITRAAVRELGLSEGARVYALIKTISFDGRSVGHTAPPRA